MTVADIPSRSAEPPGVGLLVEPSETVLTLTINRPRRKNAMDTETWQRLLGTLGRTALDESVRSVVLTGAAGDFCAGADLANRRGDVHPLTDMRMINAVAAALHDLPQPVVAKVRGVAAGAGCNLALGCDLVVADTTARFSQIFAKRGLSLDFGGSWLLPRLVGLQQSKRLAFLAGTIGAEEARELGMVTWVKEPEELDGFVADLTEQLAKTAPVALAHSKALLHQAVSLTFRESLEGEARAQLINFGTDGPAARRAFLEKSEPVFEGKWQL